MDLNLTDNEALIARVQQLEQERDALHKDIEQLCIQQAGPGYLGVATRMHFERTAVLEQEIENLKKKLSACTRENQNLQEELSEAYRVKSQLADLHNAEVSKNVEAEKQLKFFQNCVAAAFAERDNAIMEAEKAKEREELMPQELNKSRKRVEELTSELLEEKELISSLRKKLEIDEKENQIFKEVIDKFYDIRQCALDDFKDVSLEEKRQCLLNDSDEMWTFENDEESSTSSYISSLEAENGTLRKNVDNLQNKLRVGLEIETHLKKKVHDLEKEKILSEKNIEKQISALVDCYSQHRVHITSLLDEGYSELKSISDMVVEKINQLELIKEDASKSSLVQDTESHESEYRDVHVNSFSASDAVTETKNPRPPIETSQECSDTSQALAQALQEKVAALLLLSQQEERHLLERNVNAALQKKVEELQRNLLQVTNEKVKALVELAQLKQEKYLLQEKIGRETPQGKNLGDTEEQRILQEKDGKVRGILKRAYLSRWIGGSDGRDTKTHGKPTNPMDVARMKIENATLKESLDSMEHLISSVRRLRFSLLKVKDEAAAESAKTSSVESLDRIIYEAKLLKTALGCSLPVSWSAETDGSCSVLDPGHEKVDFVSATGLEMVELLIFASEILKNQTSHNNQEDVEMPVGSPVIE